MQNKTEKLNKSKQMILTIFLAMGTMIVLSNISALAIILPCFMDAFQSDMVTVQWLSNGYSACVCMTILVVGYFSDKFSAKNTLLIGLLLMLVFSVFSCFASNIYHLIILRLFIGLGAGLVLPTIPTIIYQSLSKDMQLTAMSINSVATGVGCAFGPVIAGFLEVFFDWKCLYIYTAALAVILIVPLWKLAPEVRHTVTKKMDWPMFAVGAAGTFLLLLGCSYGGKWGWTSFTTISTLITGSMLIILFITVQWKLENPMLNVRTLHIRYFRNGCIMYALSGIALILSPTVMSFYFQRVWGYSALQAGEAVLIPTVMYSIASLLIGKYGRKLPAKWYIFAMYTVLSIVTYMLGQLTPETTFLYILIWLSLRYIASGSTDPLIGNCIYAFVPEEVMGHASSVCNWMRQIVLALALAVFTAIIDSCLLIHMTNGLVYEIAMCNALNYATIISMIILIICIPVSLTIKDKQK